MHIAEYFYTLVQRGDPVHVFGRKPANVTSSTPLGSSQPAPAPEPIPTPPPSSGCPALATQE
jgi:hypothetical protein